MFLRGLFLQRVHFSCPHFYGTAGAVVEFWDTGLVSLGAVPSCDRQRSAVPCRCVWADTTQTGCYVQKYKLSFRHFLYCANQSYLFLERTLKGFVCNKPLICQSYNKSWWKLHCALKLSSAPLLSTKTDSVWLQCFELTFIHKQARYGSSLLFTGRSTERTLAFLVHQPHTICAVESRSAKPGRHQEGASLIRHSSAEQYMFEEDHIYISSGLFSIDLCMPNWPALGSGSRQH